MALSRIFLLLCLFLVASVLTYQSLSVARSSAVRNFGRSRAAGAASSALVSMPRDFAKARRRERRFHTAVTATSALYNRWQCRIMYYWYKKFKDEAGSEMGGFTRVLHSGKPDNLMDEIPTFVVDPLPPGMDKGYVVLNRPWAFVQWLQKANIEEEYIFMAEPDHVILRPIPNLAIDDMPAAYPFFYITPKSHEKLLRRYFPEDRGPITNIDPIGNSPVIIKKSHLLRVAPTWANVSLQLKNDPAADKAFGWVLEMYGYAVASALHGIQHILHKNFMVQPPWDGKLGEVYMIHYTYGCDYTMKGELTYGKVGEWRFDKRSYTQKVMPQNLTLPPPGVPETVVRLVQMVNEATANLPNWTMQ
ncbi:hydroxyproline O-arabinosyltransferase 1 isoform X1 [Selaginella moellendorffii]|nr:hydroxyproline O-arabinosyltransferase 1 isoform X1 [Selaginella moellendorffii]|eukprot:XP_002991378.2 hydroxyproline O-arabinosyltransferase 1 isoform X1 [Selaginella moellendorffii]